MGDRTGSVDAVRNQEFLYKSNKYPVYKEKLARKDLRHDVAVLLAAFKRIYSGRGHLPLGVYDKLVKDVRALGDEMPLGSTKNDGKFFCTRIANILWGVPDNHLKTERACRGEIKIPAEPDVGKNIHDAKGYYYEVRTVNGKRIGLLSLGNEMPSKNDSSWAGFEEKVATLSSETDALVLDLRGNRGGMSDNIRWLANFLYGNPAKMVDEIIYSRESAGAHALFHNEVVFEIIDAIDEGRPVQGYLLKRREDELKKFKELDKTKPGWTRYVREGSTALFDPQKGYDKPVRILINGHCASACEGGYARFLSHPRVRTYGTNTHGAAHYGDTLPLVLPRSGMRLFIPSSFREFQDGRFIEKVGYAPDVRVPDGRDALEMVVNELTRTK